MRGANVHPNGTHLIGGPAKAAGEPWDIYDNWTAPFTDFEPRLFPRWRAHYDNGYSWCERLASPFINEAACRVTLAQAGYVHLKYCKRDPYVNLSPEFAHAVRARLGVGPELDANLRACVRRWNLAGASTVA